MAGDSHPTGPPHKPSTSSTASSRKSRWESSFPKTTGTTTTTTVTTAKPSETKPGMPKPGPSPKPSPVQPKQHPPAPSPGPGSFSFPDPAAFGPPPPPVYGFHMLERRTFVLADGSVRSYFALPPDYPDFPPPHMNPSSRFLPFGPGAAGRDYWNPAGLEGRGPAEGSAKRKFPELVQEVNYPHLDYNGFPKGPVNRREFPAGTSSPFRREVDPSIRGGDDARANKFMRVGGGGGHDGVGFRQGGGGDGENVGHKHLQVDQSELKKAFLNYVKLIHESTQQRKIFLEDGKHGRLHCLACARSTKDFPDMHSLIMHTYNSDTADLRVEHLGLHKALCVLMGWDYLKPPDNSKTYQFLSAEEAAANVDDLIMWPPMVIVHNTATGKSKDGRMEGLGNKAMDNNVRDLGFGSGKSKSLYGRDGHLGLTLVKFSGDEEGVKEAIQMAEFFEKDNHGRRGWSRVQPPTLGSKDDENNPNLVKFDEKTRERKRVLYGYLATAYDLDKVDLDTRKKAVVESLREYRSAK